MFKSLDLSLIVEFMLMFYKDKPIDWLLDHIMWVKVCNPEKDAVSVVTTVLKQVFLWTQSCSISDYFKGGRKEGCIADYPSREQQVTAKIK